jgi:hypothetical protein
VLQPGHNLPLELQHGYAAAGSTRPPPSRLGPGLLAATCGWYRPAAALACSQAHCAPVDKAKTTSALSVSCRWPSGHALWLLPRLCSDSSTHLPSRDPCHLWMESSAAWAIRPGTTPYMPPVCSNFQQLPISRVGGRLLPAIPAEAVRSRCTAHHRTAWNTHWPTPGYPTQLLLCNPVLLVLTSQLPAHTVRQVTPGTTRLLQPFVGGLLQLPTAGSRSSPFQAPLHSRPCARCDWHPQGPCSPYTCIFTAPKG